ncbi:MAG: hypothetical protein ACYC91_13050 [Solirubrobacteraceae bacterium]
MNSMQNAAIRPRATSLARAVSGGGTDGNERLSTLTGILLIGLLAVLGLTILRIGQLIAVHLFVGFLLVGPVVLKLASTGYRFIRYYLGQLAYRRKGPPVLWMRSIAPVIVLSTVVVFLSGVILLLDGPAGRATWLLVHKASFVVWIVFTGLHVLGHLPDLLRWWSAGRGNAPLGVGGVVDQPGAGVPLAGRAGRTIAVATAIAAGLVLAVVLIPDYSIWTGHFPSHHHR